LFYSNLWIALNAAAQVVQTRLLLNGELSLPPSAGFVFFGTLFIYALHRSSGLKRVAPFTGSGRYQIISRYKGHIEVYALLGLAGAAVFFWLLPGPVRWLLLLPGALALGYVIPLGKNGKRLRDLHFLKIFLIALVWAWLTVWLPAAEQGRPLEPGLWRMGLERALFIFAITLPFDIRDMQIDRHTRVKTLPAALGVRPALALAFAALLLMLAMVWLNVHSGFYPSAALPALGISALLSAVLTGFANRVTHDYYFTGLIDGMMIVQFGLVAVFTCGIFSF
jgi:hypothetical protein